MRILHTSDWHLGVDYAQRSRHDEQKHFLAWLLRTLDEREIDVLVIAGDIFDSGTPSAEAQQLYFGFLAEVGRRSGKTGIVIGGNHDSASRLDAPREVLSALSTHVIGGYQAERGGDLGDPAGDLIPIRKGEDIRLVVAAVPYVSDWRLGAHTGFDADAASQQRGVGDAFRDLYARLADKAAARFPGVPLMATGHLTCLAKAGDQPTAEDAIPLEINRVGTIGALGPDIFDARYGYVALGHIHRGFAVDPQRRVWYSGTPLQVSAAEPADSRQVLVVDVKDGTFGVNKLRVPVRRRLINFRGSRDEVQAMLRQLTWSDAELPPYVGLDVTLATVDPTAADALRKAAPEGPGGQAHIVEVKTRVPAVTTATAAAPLPYASEITPESAFRFAWQAKHGHVAIPEPIMGRFRALLEAPDSPVRTPIPTAAAKTHARGATAPTGPAGTAHTKAAADTPEETPSTVVRGKRK
jgi:exonuclease SbcD